MQFFIYDPNWNPEAQAAPPSPELIQEIGRHMDDMIKRGKLVATGGIASRGTRVKLADGKFTVTDGPFIELKELMGGWAIVNADSLDEAIELSKSWRKIIGDGESEIVQIYGPNDAGSQP